MRTWTYHPRKEGRIFEAVYFERHTDCRDVSCPCQQLVRPLRFDLELMARRIAWQRHLPLVRARALVCDW